MWIVYLLPSVSPSASNAIVCYHKFNYGRKTFYSVSPAMKRKKFCIVDIWQWNANNLYLIQKMSLLGGIDKTTCDILKITLNAGILIMPQSVTNTLRILIYSQLKH